MLTKSLLLGALAAYTNAVMIGDSDGYLADYGQEPAADDHADDHHSDHESDGDHHHYRRGYSHRRYYPSDGYLARYGDNHAHHSYSYYHHSDEESEDDHHHYADESSDDDHHHYYKHYDYRYGPSARYIAKHYGAGHGHHGDYEPVDVDGHHDDEPRGEYTYVPQPAAEPVGPAPEYTPQDLSWIFEDDHFEPIHDESEYHGDGHGDDAHAYRRYPYGYNAYNGYYFADPWDSYIGYNPAHQGTSKNRETDSFGWTNGKFGYGDAYGSNFDEATHDYSDAKAYSENDYYNYGPRDYYVRNHYNPNFLKHVFDRTFVDELSEDADEGHYEEADHAVEEPRYDVPYITPAEEPEYIVHPYQPQGDW